MPQPLSLALLTCLVLAAAPMRAPAQELTIYRCLGANNKLTLRDSPCAPGETQQVRAMQRPKDPTAVSAPAPQTTAKATAPPPREVTVIYRTPPRPLYECVTADGARYTSDNGEGNPRWVPLWTLGYPGWRHHHGGGHASTNPYPPTPHADLDAHAPRPIGIVPLGGTWVRDECHALPQQEVCARLSDRRYEILRRYNSAMQSERRQLDLEQRGIDARLANDCGIQ